MILRGVVLGLCTLFFVAPLAARPLITSSEETPAQLCLAQERVNEDLIPLCEMALADPRATSQLSAALEAALGDAHRWSSDFDLAEEAYERALEWRSGEVQALNGLGFLAFERDDPEAQLAFFSRSLKHKITAEGLAGKASAIRTLDVGDTEEAILYLEASLEINPYDGWTRRELGWTRFWGGDYTGAEADFRKQLEASEFDYNALYGLSRSLYRQDKYDEALKVLAIGSGEYQSDGLWYGLRSDVLFDMRRFSQAEREANSAIEFEPDISRHYLRRAEAQIELRKWADAQEGLEQALELFVGDAYLTYHASRLFFNMDVYERTVALMTAQAQVAEMDGFDLEILAGAYFELHQYGDAITTARQAAALPEKVTHVHYYLVMSHIYLDQSDDWKQAYEAAGVGMEDWMRGEVRGALLETGRFQDAIKLYWE